MAACIDAAYAVYKDVVPDLPPVSEGCAEDIANNQVWIADAAGRIAGCLILVSGNGWMKLANVAVHPDFGGKGLGKALITLAEHKARFQGVPELRLNTHAAMPRNIQLYSRLGWKEASRSGNTVSMTKLLEISGNAG